MKTKKIKYKLFKDDPIIVTAGKDKKTKTKIVSVDKINGKVLAENVAIVKRHTKPNALNPDGGIIEKSMPVDISNVMYLCGKCDKGVRLGVKILENGKKSRFCKSCGELLDKK